MKIYIKNLGTFSKLSLLVLGLVLVGVTMFVSGGRLLSTLDAHKQLSSVGSGLDGCYTPTDITALQANKSFLEISLGLADTELVNLESRIQETVKTYDAQTVELERLKKSVITDDVVALREEGINIIQQQLTDAEQAPPTSSGVCSAEGYYDEFACTMAGSYSGANCSGGYGYDTQDSCEKAGYTYGGGCSNGMYYDKYSCESSGSSGYVDSYSYSTYGSGYCSNSAYADQYSCVNGGYYTAGSCSMWGFNDEQSCVNAEYTYGGYCNGGYMYADEASCENAGAYPGYCSGGSQYENELACTSAGAQAAFCVAGTQYSDENSCNSAVCSSTPASCSDGVSITYEACINNDSTWSPEVTVLCGNTWVPANPPFGYTWYAGWQGYGYQWIPEYSIRQNYTWNPGVFVSQNNTWTEPVWYMYWNPWYWFTANTWTEPSFQTYGYVWNPGTWTLQGNTWTPTDNKATIASLTETLETLKADYAKDIEENIVAKERVQTAEATLVTLTEILRVDTTEKANVKARKAEVKKKQTELGSDTTYALQNLCSTDITGTEIYCSNAIDDDTDGLMDCSDSDCSSDSLCTPTVTDILPPLVDVDSTEHTVVKSIKFPKSYDDQFNLLIGRKNKVEKTNTEVVIPLMEFLRDKSQGQDIAAILKLINDAKNAVSENKIDLSNFKTSIDYFQTENDAYTDYLKLKENGQIFAQAATSLYSAYSSYFSTLLDFLTGQYPTPELENRLNARIASLQINSLDFGHKKSDLESILAEIKRKAPIELSSIAISPGSHQTGVSIAGTREIVIQFDKQLDQYNSGSLNITSDTAAGSLSVSTTQIHNTQKDTLVVTLIDTLQPSTAYLVSADIQLTVEGKAVQWKKSWSFVTEAGQGLVDEEKDKEDEDEDDGAEPSAKKCSKIRKFFNFIFGSCEDVPQICCVCVYGDTNTDHGGAETFVKDCDQQIRENDCTASTKKYTPDIKDEIKAESEFPKDCPATKYDNVKFLRSIHGFDKGDEKSICKLLPEGILNGYMLEGDGIPSQIGINSGSCNDFNNMDEAERYAKNLATYMREQGYENVKISIKGNQNNSQYDIASGRSYQNLCTPATFVVCSEGVKKQLESCPARGDYCVFGENETNRIAECQGEDGKPSSRECVDSGEQNPYGQRRGEWQ